MVIRVNRYVQINTPNGAGTPAEIPPFSPSEFFNGGLAGYWQGQLEVEGEFDPTQLFGNEQDGTWLGSVAPEIEVITE